MDWLAHYKRMRIVNKYMGVHCTLYILNITMMINQEKGKEVMQVKLVEREVVKVKVVEREGIYLTFNCEPRCARSHTKLYQYFTQYSF